MVLTYLFALENHETNSAKHPLTCSKTNVLEMPPGEGFVFLFDTNLNPIYPIYADYIRVNNSYRPVGRIGQGMKTHRENRTQAEKQYDIRCALVIRSQREDRVWLSTNEIARAVGLARNGRFKATLDWMVQCGTLIRRECERLGRWPGYEYALSDDQMEFHFTPRPIKVKNRGKVVASLEMF